MIALAVLLLAATPADDAAQGAIAAERAFAAMAQAEGQWTAFRHYAAEDAVMFVEQPVNAQEWLADREDPPASVMWRPAESYVSCDGSIVVNTGPWERPDGSTGFFTTVWQRQADGSWHWLLDHGGPTYEPREAPPEPLVHRARCPTGEDRRRTGAVIDELGYTPQNGRGYSDDRTLRWRWDITVDGQRVVRVGFLAGGPGFYRTVVDDRVEMSGE